MISKEFFKQIEAYAEEKQLDVEQVMESFKNSILKATQKETGKTAKVEFNPSKNEILVYTVEKVVEEYSNSELEEGEQEISEILLEDAKKIKSSAKVGDIIETAVNPKGFSRQTARSAKSTFGSDIKGVEREKAYEYFKQFVDEMITADIIDINDKFLILSVGQGITTVLPKGELLKNDEFGVGDRIKVYVKKVEQGSKGPKIVVSRSDKNLVIRLLENTISEIKDGIVEIKGIARDAGDRCKIAIYSNDEKVDALGACVGTGGERIKEVVAGLNGEKIDLYKWSEDPEELIANSLQPAHVSRVLNVDVKNKTSLAIVPDDQLSLAIGKAGQNVRLAVMSSGWKIDIKPLTEAYAEGLLNDLLFDKQ